MQDLKAENGQQKNFDACEILSLEEAQYSFFDQVLYLGCSSIDNPKAELEIQSAMRELNKQCNEMTNFIDVTLAVPYTCDGEVKLFDANSIGQSYSCLARFSISRILFCARGRQAPCGDDKSCFAFTCAIDHQSNFLAPLVSGVATEKPSLGSMLCAIPATFVCHVFRCRNIETVGKILLCFATAFKVQQKEQKPHKNALGDSNDDIFGADRLEKLIEADAQVDFQFDVFLEIKEDDDKGTFVLSPQERNCFKLRRDREKRLQVALQQMAGPKILHVQKCFGLLLAAGRNVKHSDMHLMDVKNMGPGNDDRTYLIEADWNPKFEQFEVLNTETPKDTRVYMTIAADLVFSGIQEPDSLSFGQSFASSVSFEISSCESATERDRRSRRLSSDRSPSKMPANLVAPPDDDDTDSDEPLLSGSGGEVLGPCSNETMADWQRCLELWSGGCQSMEEGTQLKSHDDQISFDAALMKLSVKGQGDAAALSGDIPSTQVTDDGSAAATSDCMTSIISSPKKSRSFSIPANFEKLAPHSICDQGQRLKACSAGRALSGGDKRTRRRPKQLQALIVRNGVPDELRGRIWQLLAGCYGDSKMTDTYRLLLSKECPNEQVILRDIHRTFPAHEYFKDAGGDGQEALYRISKAYSLYDEDVGYCQGLSFLAASLLLHISEDEAFCVLVKIMFDYGLRDLFKRGFEALHLRFYQLERLIEDFIPDLHQHFQQINVETHMYASQWFLTLFTAKFTLSVVFRIIDLFLCEGMYTIFHISIALLKAWKRQLMELDFEGALKYFRVFLPRKYRTEHEAQELIQQAVKLEISNKRLSKYEKEYIAIKNREVETQDPIERLEKECVKLRDSMMRLERENDDLAHELVTSKIQLRKNLDAAEDNIESLQGQIEKFSTYCRELEDNTKRLLAESEQVKEMCRREIQRMDDENNRCSTIISNYKQICSDLGNRLDQERAKCAEKFDKLRTSVLNCPACSHSEWLDELLAISPRSEGSPRVAASDQSLDGYPPSPDFEQQQQTRRLELELARTKLALVESQCKNQDLCHKLAALQQNQGMQQSQSNNNHQSGGINK